MPADSNVLGEKLAVYCKADAHTEYRDCFSAVHARVKKVFGDNNREVPEINVKDSQATPFDLLWRSRCDLVKWKDITPDFRACGPCGALALKGWAVIVPHAKIWEGGLAPGAVIQVWDTQQPKGSLRPSGDYANGKATFQFVFRGGVVDTNLHFGHSFIFLEYVKAPSGRIAGMRIEDQGTGWDEGVLRKETFGLWIGANIRD